MEQFFLSFSKCLGFIYDEKEENRLNSIKEQIEFYFSDMNLENDNDFSKLILKSENRFINISYLLNRNRLKMLNATEEDIIFALKDSNEIEIDEKNFLIRSKIPFISDPRRKYRTLRISGLPNECDYKFQYEFFKSIFNNKLIRLSLYQKNFNNKLIYTGRTFIELNTEEEAKIAFERGIEFNDKLLEVQIVGNYYEELKKK